MSVPADLWPQISRLLDESLNLEGAARAAWLVNLREHSPELAAHLGRLLAAHERPVAADPLQAPPARLLVDALAGQASGGTAPLFSGQMLGPYRLIQPIGEGGMAEVWLAEQTLNVLRRVALKIPRQGLEEPSATAARFINERDLLASLENPNIARLYDAGISADQHPYLAMEWIVGIPITRYADEQRLDIAKRVQLFQQVLQAVRYAHARLVIHRDLKPSNILVTATGEVKLLDFGIARLLSDPESGPVGPGGSLVTRALTPESASPEQLAGETLGTPSDVYSLGVVLYELLTAQRPYRLQTADQERSASALHAALLAAPFTPPSKATLSDAAAAARATTTTRLRRALTGDLDAILRHALSKDAADRYASAEALSLDLERWRTQRPVAARTPTLAYRTGRLFLRNRIAVIASTLATLALCGGLGMALWQAQRAKQEASLAESVQSFLSSLFEANDPQQAQGQDVSARDLLARGAKRLDTELKDQPVVLARLERVIGGLYVELGDNIAAQPHLKRALSLYAQTGLSGTEEGVEAAFKLFETYDEELQYEEARKAAEQCLALAEKNFGPHNRWQLPLRRQLAWQIIDNHPQAAINQLKQALADAAKYDPRIGKETLKTQSTLGSGYLQLGQFELARDTFQKVVDAAPAVSGYQTTDNLVDRYNLARALYNLRAYAQSEAELSRLVGDMDRHLGPMHDRTVKARALWAQALAELGQYSRAVDVQRQNLEYARSRTTADDEVLSLQRLTLAKLLKIAARPQEGLPLARAGLAFMDGKYAEPFWNREIARRLVAELLLEQGDTDSALRTLSTALENARRIDNFAGNAAYADVLQVQAVAYRLRGHSGDAARSASLLEQALGIYAGKLGAQNPGTLRCAAQLAWLNALEAPGDAEQLSRFEQAASAYETTLPPGHVVHAEVLLMRAELSRRAGQAASARLQELSGRRAWRSAMGSAYSPPFTWMH